MPPTPTFLLFLSLLLLSCEPQKGKNDMPGRESVAGMDTVGVTGKAQADESLTPCQQELDKALADPAIADYYKDIYRQEKLISADDDTMLTVTRHLFTKDAGKDLFFFIVFTKSMNGSDGFYAEAVDNAAMRFVTENTEWFADYFTVAPKLNDSDLDNWARAVCGEIRITRENHEEKAVLELEALLLGKIKETRKEYEVVIKRFIQKVKEQCDCQ